ncbi:MAG: cation diffusion facilitator family transporter [Thermincola sp.]|jgi:cation diffusion facilitator family transporter|nr:cation diffusion facilitator family transporter [Thermincola sp.]MDT3703652.1 cation diffusion facilitator family transporter [Thermincola sp.]
MEGSLNEKTGVALTSVIASFLLTAGKLTVGILTGSLGILSEAAHSALDCGAAVITYFAVRVSDKPADKDHHYGHAKVENFSALIEAVLLFITCAWIIKEAVSRLFFKSESIEVTVWSFLVIIVSIIVDFSRSRALSRAAKKYKSQALEADALHFSSDILSSIVVLIGLIFTEFGVMYADPLAALVVALIVIIASWRLAKRTIDTLLDTAPAGLDRQIADEVMEIPGVAGVHKVRLRQSGGNVQGDLHVVMERNISFVDGHKIATKVEESLAKHSSDIVVHFEPEDDWEEVNKTISETTEKVKKVLRGHQSSFHELEVSHGPNGLLVSIHVILPKELSVMEARERCDVLENAIRNELAGADVHLRIEPCDGLCSDCAELCPKNQE